MSEENRQVKSNSKNLIIAGLIGVLCLGGYYQYTKVSLKDSLLSQKQQVKEGIKAKVQSGKDKIKEGVHNKVAGFEGKMKANQEKLETPTVGINDRNMGENQIIDIKDTNGSVQINNLPVSAKNADLLLMAAVKAGDLDRAKTLIESGVNLNFTNNKLCMGLGSENATLEVPSNIEQLKAALVQRSARGQYMLMTDCSKLFLLASTASMRKPTSDAEIYAINNYGFSVEQMGLPDSNPNKQSYLRAKQKDLDSIQAEQKKEDVFSFLMDKIDFFMNDNFSKLPFIYRNVELPLSVRVKALKAYLNVRSNPAKIKTVPNVEAFNRLSVEIADSVSESARKGSFNSDRAIEVKNGLEYAGKQSDIMDEDFLLFLNEYVKNAGTYVRITRDLDTNGGSAPMLKQAGLNYQSDLELSLNSLKQNGISYQKNRQNMLAYTNYGAGSGFYSLEATNELIKMINMVLDLQLVNLNRQYADGSTVLHWIADYNSCCGFTEEEGQALAVMNRYLLNKGANPNLFNKKGQTALEVVMTNDALPSANNKYKALLKSYQDINFQK